MKIPNWVRRFAHPIGLGILGVALIEGGMELGLSWVSVAGLGALTAAFAQFLPPAEAAKAAQLAEELIQKSA